MLDDSVLLYYMDVMWYFHRFCYSYRKLEKQRASRREGGVSKNRLQSSNIIIDILCAPYIARITKNPLRLHFRIIKSNNSITSSFHTDLKSLTAFRFAKVSAIRRSVRKFKYHTTDYGFICTTLNPIELLLFCSTWLELFIAHLLTLCSSTHLSQSPSFLPSISLTNLPNMNKFHCCLHSNKQRTSHMATGYYYLFQLLRIRAISQPIGRRNISRYPSAVWHWHIYKCIICAAELCLFIRVNKQAEKTIPLTTIRHILHMPFYESCS